MLQLCGDGQEEGNLMIPGIYGIRNLNNEKIYVGSSIDFEKRILEHKDSLNKNCHHNILLQRSWNKYGESSFVFFLLEKCEKNCLIEEEQYWMDFYNSYNPYKGYNINPTAGSRLGSKHTDDSKKLMSDYRKSDMYWWRGRKHSPETIEKLKESKRGDKNPFYGKHLTEEHKRKVGDGVKGKDPWNKGKSNCYSEETINKISNSLKGDKNPFYKKHHSEETIRKMKDAWIRRKKKTLNG